MTAVPAAQVSAVLAWAARLSAAGPAAGTAETVAGVTATARVPYRALSFGARAAIPNHSPGPSVSRTWSLAFGDDWRMRTRPSWIRNSVRAGMSAS